MPDVVEPELSYIGKPIPPMIPDAQQKNIEEVVNTDPLLNIHKMSVNPVNKKASIGVMDFKTNSEQGSASLVSDIFSIHLHDQGMKVVERQNIKRIVEEQQMAANNLQRLTDEQVAQKIGKLTSADYIVFGAVTQYHFENTSMQISYEILSDDFEKYLQELGEYKKAEKLQEHAYQEYLRKYYKYLESKIFRTIYYNDLKVQIHRNDSAPRRWAYKSFSNLELSAFSPEIFVLPVVGKSEKELKHDVYKLQEERQAALESLKKIIDSYESSITVSEWRVAVSKTMSSWQDYLRYQKEDEYIQKTKRMAKKITGKFAEIYAIDRQIKQSNLTPIPAQQKDFDLPKPTSEFVSVANLGITFKVIDVKTGDIVWIGQTSKRDFNIQSGLNAMIQSVVKKILH